MKHIYARRKKIIGVCLIVSQLLAFQGAQAQSFEESSLDSAIQFQNVYKQNKKKKKRSRILLFDQLNGGEFQVSASAGYISNTSTANVYHMPTEAYKYKSEGSGVTSDLSIGYGLTDNFYSKLKLEYGSFSAKKTTSALYNATAPNGEVTAKSSGITEPSVLLGAQVYLGSTQLFSELSLDIPVGDKETKQTSNIETTENNLRGGMRYAPRAGIVHDFGNILLMGGISYVINDERTAKFDDRGYITSVKTSGGNKAQLVTGIEFKKMSRLGFVLGYEKEESAEKRLVHTGQVSKSPENSALTATSYLGIKVGSNSYLVPQIAYSTLLEKNIGPVDIKQYDTVVFNLGTQFSF